ncbi:MAG TPA: filamentous hemagglutinin N-terminal domain-containing protein [Tepidisphaeraceae bacterium]|jgi:filamentous hemagglutinin family protein
MLAAVAAIAVSASATAQIATDGSLGGAATSLRGADLTIPAALGRRVGRSYRGSLLHSFRDFNVNAGQTVRFQQDPRTQRVIARVTGPNRSFIEGRLVSPVSLYLMNPSGITVAGGASIEVNGVVALTAADEIRFPNGEAFSASPAAATPVLATTPPSAFGFLRSDGRASVAFRGAGRGAPAGSRTFKPAGDGTLVAVSVTGQAIDVRDSAIDAPVLHVLAMRAPASASTPQEIDFDFAIREANGLGPEVDLGPGPYDEYPYAFARLPAAGGDVRLTDSRLAGAGDDQNPGLLLKARVHGGDVSLTRTRVDAVDFFLVANDRLNVASSALSDKYAPQEVIRATDSYWDRSTYTSTYVGGSEETPNFTTDPFDGSRYTVNRYFNFAGDATFVRSAVEVQEPLELRADSLRLDRSTMSVLPSAVGGRFGLVLTPGTLVVHAAGDVLLANGASLRGGIDSAFQPVGGGELRLSAARLTLGGGSSIDVSNLDQGAGGAVTISAADVRVLEGSRISSAAAGLADGGSVTLRASGGVEIRGRRSAVTAGSGGGGDGGDVRIRGRHVTIADGGGIVVDATDLGSSGNVSIVADVLRVEGGRHGAAQVRASTAGKTADKGREGLVEGTITIDIDETSLEGYPDFLEEVPHELIAPDGTYIPLRTISQEGDIVRYALEVPKDRSVPVAGQWDFAPSYEFLLLPRIDSFSCSINGQVIKNAPVVFTGEAEYGQDFFFRLKNGNVGPLLSNSRAGEIRLRAGVLSLDGAVVGSEAGEVGPAGSVRLAADRGLTIQASVVRASALQNSAGGLLLESGATLDVSDADLDARSPRGPGGEVRLRAVRAITIDRSSVSAAADRQGNVFVTSGGLINVRRSEVVARAANDGGRIEIEPGAFVLRDSTIDGTFGAGARRTLVSVTPDAAFFSNNSVILATDPTLPPDVDLAGALLRFDPQALTYAATLQQDCVAQLKGRFSSFLVSPRQGLPGNPDWRPAAPEPRATINPPDPSTPGR